VSASIVFGGSGYVGTLIVAAVLAEAPRPLVLPIRATADREACMARIRTALLARGIAHDALEQRLGLISLIELPAPDRLDELAPMLRTLGADELIHSAGCLDYWDTRLLHSVNVDLTRAIVALARTAGISRILYISTAYCSGYTDELIREQLHSPPAPHDEPTEYTRTKRIAEAIVADSGVPFVIIRPSIIIGDSQSGHYAGKNYGLYQWWRAIEGLLTREYNPIWYTVATHARLNLLHHDAFQAAILAIRATDLRASIIHVVSDDANCPTTRELCWLWADVYRPAEIHCYPSVDSVPLMAIPKRQRRVLELAAKNLEISTRRWRFETRALDLLRRAGLGFADATLASVARCQTRYIEQSTRIQTYLHSLRPSSAGEPRLFDIAGY
jgi:nucleoside-diphosphate-sugar epimerase